MQNVDLRAASPGEASRAADRLRGLTPDHLGFVMATGIVCIDVGLRGWRWLSVLLLWVTGASYVVLVALSVWRAWALRDVEQDDLHDPGRAFGFFDLVAGTGVLGAALLDHGHHLVAVVLLCLAATSWLALGYAVPWLVALGRIRRPVLASATGSWFIWAVAAQSVAVLAAELAAQSGTARRGLALLAVLAWSVGLLLYASVGVLVAVRLTAYRVQPEDLNPTYWVAMGATAITVVAGVRIAEIGQAAPAQALRPMATATALVLWGFGTWLVPALLAAGWWRHRSRHVPLRFEPAWWAMVFPLGMYGVGCQYLGELEGLTVVARIGEIEGLVALAAWIVVSAWAVASAWAASSRRSRRAG